MANTLHEYAHLPQVDRRNVQLLWHNDFWDGPLSGLCLYGGRKYWFAMCAEGGEDDPFYLDFRTFS